MAIHISFRLGQMSDEGLEKYVKGSNPRLTLKRKRRLRKEISHTLDIERGQPLT
jgi:hypothetical protein